MKKIVPSEPKTINWFVKSWANASAFPISGEINDQPSETVPDQTLSVRQILKRYASGMTDLGGHEGEYLEEDEEDNFDQLPDPRTLDLAERQELMEIYQEELTEKRRNYAKAQQEAHSNSRPKPENTGTDKDPGSQSDPSGEAPPNG